MRPRGSRPVVAVVALAAALVAGACATPKTPVAPDLYAYNLFRSTTPGGPYTQIGGDIPAGTLVYSDTAVTSGVA